MRNSETAPYRHLSLSIASNAIKMPASLLLDVVLRTRHLDGSTPDRSPDLDQCSSDAPTIGLVRTCERLLARVLRVFAYLGGAWGLSFQGLWSFEGSRGLTAGGRLRVIVKVVFSNDATRVSDVAQRRRKPKSDSTSRRRCDQTRPRPELP